MVKVPQHHIYLLAIWEENSDDPATPGQWRYRLEHPASGQQQGFASLAALVVALQQLTGEPAAMAGKSDQDGLLNSGC